MARKKKHPEHVNHERWLISYADFITLLFAFFVVMFAVSQVDSKKVGRFSEAFSKAVGVDIFPEPGHAIMGGNDEAAAPGAQNSGRGSEVLPPELEGLKDALKNEAASGDELKGLQIVQHKRELVLRLPENIFFASGDDSLKDSAVKMLHALALQLKPRPVDVRVEGHTDTRPISTVRFRSNWDLSTARSTAVVMRLSKEGMGDNHLSAAGYGEFRPIAVNTTDDGRKQNRRVDLVVSVSDPDPDPPPTAAAPAAPGAPEGAPAHDAPAKEGEHAAHGVSPPAGGPPPSEGAPPGEEPHAERPGAAARQRTASAH